MTTPTAEAESSDVDQIPALRQEIDDLDRTIAELVGRRAAVSHRIQAARVSTGGTRIQLGREREILDGYRRALGSDGVQLGSAVLRVCRGNT